MSTQNERTMRALNILAKWRVLFTGWQLGTRLKGDPEGDAVRDHREVTILLRAESSALIGLLIRKGVFTHGEWLAALEEEANLLCADYERKFPGVTASEDGLTFDRRTLPWMKGWKP
jgi:hypothetical protein